jgi:hypothetical protein
LQRLMVKLDGSKLIGRALISIAITARPSHVA